MNQKAISAHKRAVSDQENKLKEQACNFPIGAKIIGELGARFWLLQKQAIEEGEEDAERLHNHDKNGTAVP